MGRGGAVHVAFLLIMGSVEVGRSRPGRRGPRSVCRSDWSARARARVELMDDAIDLIAVTRAELQGRPSRGYFIVWRLS
jgi:hypothetical protein